MVPRAGMLKHCVSADLAVVVVGAAAADAASANLKIDVQVLDFSAAAAAAWWYILMYPKMACYMPAFKLHFDMPFTHFY